MVEDHDDDAPPQEDDDDAPPPQEEVEFGSFERRTQVALDSRHSFFPSHQPYLLYMWHMLQKHDLLVTSWTIIDEDIASDAGKSVPSSINTRGTTAEPAEEDHTSGLWDSAASASRVAMGLTSLSNSLEFLGNKAVTAAEVQAHEQEKNRSHDAAEREKARTHEVAQKARDSHEQEKNRRHEVAQKLRDSIARLKAEKRRLCHELIEHSCSNKKNKAMIDMLEEHIAEVEKEKEDHENKMNSLLETPRKSNRTPDSAIRGRGGHDGDHAA